MQCVYKCFIMIDCFIGVVGKFSYWFFVIFYEFNYDIEWFYLRDIVGQVGIDVEV